MTGRAVPTIVGELGGLNHLSWVVTSYLLAITVVTPLYGKLGDLYGRKVVLQGALILFLVGSALCGMKQKVALTAAHLLCEGKIADMRDSNSDNGAGFSSTHGGMPSLPMSCRPERDYA